MLRKYVAPVGLFLMSIFIFAGIFAFQATAFAADAVTPDDSNSLLDVLKPVYVAFRDGNKLYAGALAVVAALALLKRYGSKLGSRFDSFVNGDVGGAIFALLTSFAGTVAAAFASGSTVFAWSVLWTAGGVAVTAAGGYTLLKKLIVSPLLASKWYATAPLWAKTLIGMVSWVFGDSPAIANAEAAGAAAVAAKPATGPEAVTGKPTELT